MTEHERIKKSKENAENLARSPWGSSPAKKEEINMHFYVFVWSTDNTIFGVTDEPKGLKLPPYNTTTTGKWITHDNFEYDHRPRVGFFEDKAKEDIIKKGYHLLQSKVIVEELHGALPGILHK